MSIVTTISSKIEGIKAVKILIETEVTPGIGIHLVGLADAAVKESLLRTVTALQSNGFHIPGRKIVINLAPADLHKKGTGYDLAIALSIIAASGQASLPDLDKYLILGEIGLDGSIRPVTGTAPALVLAKELKLKGCIIPRRNMQEAMLFSEGLDVYAVETLKEAIDITSGDTSSVKTIHEEIDDFEEQGALNRKLSSWDLICGNDAARRAIEIAAAGGHNVLMCGPAGSGKTSIANALAELLPPMTVEEKKEVACIYSIKGNTPSFKPGNERPFRAPHYTCTMSSLLGGSSGDNIVPGEVTLASKGVLFLDEFANYPKSLLECLRGTLEHKKITITRLRSKVEYPTDFQLVVATPPCPCGRYGDGDKCTCTKNQRLSYLARLSGPILDRIAMQVWTNVPRKEQIMGPRPEPIESVRERIKAARELQKKRYEGTAIRTNDELSAKDMNTYCPLGEEQMQLIESLMYRLGLSAKAFGNIIKIARTIADLAGTDEIMPGHIAEAASYRFLDRRTE